MRLVSLLLLLQMPMLAHAAAFELEPLTQTVAGSQFAQRYAERQFSIATAVNGNGQLVGYQRLSDGGYASFSVATADNPALTVVDTPDFVSLSAGDAPCFWLICATEFPFGIQTGVSGPLTSFVGDTAGSSVLPGSLPFSRFPGSFVEENAHGVVASTQFGDGEQFGALLGDHGVTLLPDVRWLVAINDNQPAQALGYVGQAGDCLVFGYGCEPAPQECDTDGDGHSNDTGVGHHSHGRGYGYGHDDCHTGGSRSTSTPQGYPVLLAMNAQGAVSMLRVPTASDSGQLSQAFPLAMNRSQALFRASLSTGNETSRGRLFRCHFDASALDADQDGVLDCQGGLEQIPLDGDLSLGTVLGFTLNNAGQLMGNAGFSAAGIGLPLFADLSSDTPLLTLLANHMAEQEEHQLSVVTDLNDMGMASGYGYAGCGDQPEAIRLLPLEITTDSIRFVPGALEASTLLRPGQNYSLEPQATGAAGAALFRFQLYDPDSGQWQLLQDWSDSAYQGTAADRPHDLCIRVDLADSLDMARQRSQLLRYRVSDEQPPSTVQPGSTPGPAFPTGPAEALSEMLPTIGSGLPLSLLLLFRRRRQAA